MKVETTCPVLTDSFGPRYIKLLSVARHLDKGMRTLSDVDWGTYLESQIVLSAHSEVSNG